AGRAFGPARSPIGGARRQAVRNASTAAQRISPPMRLRAKRPSPGTPKALPSSVATVPAAALAALALGLARLFLPCSELARIVPALAAAAPAAALATLPPRPSHRLVFLRSSLATSSRPFSATS